MRTRAFETLGFTGLGIHMLGVQVLGELRVMRGDETVELPPSRKARVLLGLLATAQKPQRRERLCEMLWSVPDDPRGALRWTLSRLRSALSDDGSLVRADRQTIALAVDICEVDVLKVRAILKQGVDSAETPALKEAAATFRGPFLEGLEATGSPEVQSWIAATREEMRQLHAAILLTLDDRLAARPDEALPYARALVALDPTVEDAWARLVERLFAGGRRKEAQAQYDAAVAALREVGGAGHRLAQARRTAARALSSPTPRPPHLTLVPSAEASQAEPTPDNEPHQEIRFCRAADGVRIAYARSGNGPPLVKAANWLNHLEYDWESPIWGHFLRGLSQDHQLLRYDARGNGLSDWEIDRLSLDDWVSDLECVVDAAGYDRFPLLGVSQGCAISIGYAVRHPERVSHLVLYAGFPAGAYARDEDPAEIERRRAMTTLMRLGWGEPTAAFRQLFTSMFIPGATAQQATAFNELQRRTTTPQNAARYYEASGHLDVRSLLAEVKCPTVVLHPRGDANVSIELGRRMAAGIPGARFVPLAGENHLFLEGEPAEARFFEEMRRLLAET